MSRLTWRIYTFNLFEQPFYEIPKLHFWTSHLCVFVELWCIFLGLWHRSLHSRFLEIFFRLLDFSGHLVLFPLQQNYHYTSHKTNYFNPLNFKKCPRGTKRIIYLLFMNVTNLEKSKDLSNFSIFFSVPFCFQQGALQVPTNSRYSRSSPTKTRNLFSEVSSSSFALSRICFPVRSSFWAARPAFFSLASSTWVISLAQCSLWRNIPSMSVNRAIQLKHC